MNKLFNKYLDIYDQLYYGSHSVYKREVGEVVKYFPKGTANILDIGCGTGKHALELFRLGYKVDCIDISPLAVKIAQKNLIKYQADIKLQDIARFKNTRNYDAAIALFIVLSYLPRQSDFAKALANIYKGLKKNGVFIFDVVNGQQLENNFEPELKFTHNGIKALWLRKLDPKKQILTASVLITKGKKIYNDKQIFRYYYPDQLRQILRCTGFKNIKIYTSYKGAKDFNKKKTKLCVICYK